MPATSILVTMGSVFIGFLCMMGAFAGFMYKKPQKVIWTLFTLAIVFITVIPVVIAIGWGTLFAG